MIAKPAKALFINTTKKCNVNCPNCYLTEKSRGNKSIISIDHIVKALSDPFLDPSENNTTIIWSGGELSLLGKDRLFDYFSIVQEKFPEANQQFITNAFSAPTWLFDLAKEFVNGIFEVTYACGNKFSLSGSGEDYQRIFIKNIKKARDYGLNVIVNVETNIETINTPPSYFIELAKKTGVNQWEFDMSVAFADFIKSPIYNEYNYPILKSTATYKQLANYFIELEKLVSQEKDPSFSFKSGILTQTHPKLNKTEAYSTYFNSHKTSSFITINPDGSFTSSVFFSDLPVLHLGNLSNVDISDKLNDPRRIKTNQWESRRIHSCIKCEFFKVCNGGNSHMPLYDDSNECAGMKSLYIHMQNKYGSKSQVV